MQDWRIYLIIIKIRLKYLFLFFILLLLGKNIIENYKMADWCSKEIKINYNKINIIFVSKIKWMDSFQTGKVSEGKL